MGLDEQFTLDGIDELDTQIKLYQMGIESFSPYAGSGKVDMIIRSENNDLVRYADIKVCTGLRKGAKVTWELEVGFFMNNVSYLILTVRLPEADETMEKHHFVLEAEEFLKIAKKQKMKVQDDKWILTGPFADIQVLNNQCKSKKIRPLSRSLKKYFDNWDCLLEWRSNDE
jgi:hypothetical protein